MNLTNSLSVLSCLQKRPEPPFPSELLVSVAEPGEAGE